MILYPNAKINIGLNIIEKRSDGYHNIETLFYPIPLFDTLELLSGGIKNGIEFTSSGIGIAGNPDENLVCKAYNILNNYISLPPVRVHLHKMIPFGAGLGGGSSDAAYCLKGLNSLFELNLSDNELIELASGIGADCAFFIKNTPSFATGIGNVLESVSIDLSAYYLAIVKPNVSVSTKEAYANITPGLPLYELKKSLLNPPDQWRKIISNDFEKSVFPKHPEIADIKKTLYDAGAEFVQMSGSGSAVFGLFEKEPDISGLFPATWFCRTLKLAE